MRVKMKFKKTSKLKINKVKINPMCCTFYPACLVLLNVGNAVSRHLQILLML